MVWPHDYRRMIGFLRLRSKDCAEQMGITVSYFSNVINGYRTPNGNFLQGLNNVLVGEAARQGVELPGIRRRGVE
jgi:transcriptional regulator with XRE-family HTH domain